MAMAWPMNRQAEKTDNEVATLKKIDKNSEMGAPLFPFETM